MHVQSSPNKSIPLNIKWEIIVLIREDLSVYKNQSTNNARILELQLALDAVQHVGLNVTAPVHIQQVQEVQEVNQAPPPVEQMDTEIHNRFPVASAVEHVSQLSSDSESPIEEMKLPVQ